MFRTMQQYRQFNYQLANLWRIDFKDYPDLDFHLINTSLPMPKLEYEGRKYGEKIYTGFTAPDQITFTFRETQEFSSYKFFQDWLETLFDYEKGEYKTLNNYEDKYKSATLNFLNKNFGNKISKKTQSFDLINLMPLGFSDIDVSTDSGEPLQFTIEMAVENVRPTKTAI